MKSFRLFVVLALCLVLSLPAVSDAEETPLRKTLTIQLEGQEEPYTVTLFRWEGILSLWYAADHFAPVVTSGGLRFELIDNQLSAPVHFGVESLYDPSGMQAGSMDDVQAAYEQDGWVCEPLDATRMLPTFGQEPAQGLIARKGGQVAQAILTDVTSGTYVCTMQYPAEAAEGWGGRMAQMLNTLQALPGE